MATAKSKQRLAARGGGASTSRAMSPTVLVQVKISRHAASLLRKRARRALRTQAGYLRSLIYRDLGLIDGEV